MDDVKQQEFAELRRMFDCEGWRILTRDTAEMLKHMREQGWNTIRSMEQLWYAKGVMDTMEKFINHDKVVAAAEQMELDVGQHE